MTSLVDRRLGRLIFNSIFQKKSENIKVEDQFEKDFEANAWVLTNTNSGQSFEPTLQVFEINKVDKNSYNFSAASIGYIVERRTVGADGMFDEDTADFTYIDGNERTKYFDTQIQYGVEYSYSVRTASHGRICYSLSR